MPITSTPSPSRRCTGRHPRLDQLATTMVKLMHGQPARGQDRRWIFNPALFGTVPDHTDVLPGAIRLGELIFHLGVENAAYWTCLRS